MQIFASKRPLATKFEKCGCDAGFAGPNCNVCTMDDNCKFMPAPLGSEIICNRSPKVWRDKHFAFCKVSNLLLATAFSDPATVTVRRSLIQKTTFATMWLGNSPQFSCTASECEQKFNGTTSTNWQCKNVACKCNPGEKMCGGSFVDLSSTINRANGGVAIRCRGADECNLKCTFLANL